ncbi:ARP2/3 complex 16 kDa subunit (p16-Arc)-domain-containing protein [Lipomyces starkeyi]
MYARCYSILVVAGLIDDIEYSSPNAESRNELVGITVVTAISISSSASSIIATGSSRTYRINTQFHRSHTCFYILTPNMALDFRRIDIDALDPENNIEPEYLIPPSIANLPPLSVAEIQSIGQSIRSSLSRGDHFGALKAALDQPPYTSSEEIKKIHLATVLELLSTIKSSDMSRVVEKLSSEQRDTLIKYLYKGMSLPETHGISGVLLAWFEKVTEIAGLGAIVRYLSDRRTV